MTKKEIESYLLAKRGYLKNSPLDVAKAFWKSSGKHTLPKNKLELKKELDLIATVQSDLRRAKTIEEDLEGDNLLSIYEKIIKEKEKTPRILYWDLEVSPNLVFTWGIGNKISINHDSIVHERGIICVCYKWSDSDKVESIKWNSGDDKELCRQFAKVLNSADIISGHNIKNFDLKWFKTRCLLYDIELNRKFNVIDTLTIARTNFRFNSNRLDYISKFLGDTGKKDTSYSLWKNIVLHNCKKSMETMISYCKNDVVILEKVHKQIEKYAPIKKFKFVL